MDEPGNQGRGKGLAPLAGGELLLAGWGYFSGQKCRVRRERDGEGPAPFGQAPNSG